MLNTDFSELSELRGDYPDGLTQKEIQFVLEKENRRVANLPDFPKKDFYATTCGYSYKKRILLIVSRIANSKIQILQVKVASEQEIDFYYCGK